MPPVGNQPFYAAIGVDLAGRRDVLGLWAGAGGGGESAKFWMNVLTDIKNRGARDVFFIVCDGLKGLPDSVAAVFPAAIVQTSSMHHGAGGIVPLIRGTFRYASKRYWDQLARDLRPIYTAPTADAARAAFEELEEKWGPTYPAIPRLWRAAWEEFIPFLDYPVEIRKVLCSNERDRVPQRQVPAGGHRQGPLPHRAGRPEDALPGHQVTRSQGPRAGTMGHPMEARAERVRHHLRRPHARGRDPLNRNASYTGNRTDPYTTRRDLTRVVLAVMMLRSQRGVQPGS